MNFFKASVHYGDWKGTAAADNADARDLSAFLREKGVHMDDEFLVGVELYFGENHDGNVRSPYISAFFMDKAGNNTLVDEINATTSPLVFHKVKVALTIEEFFGLFKRFSVVMTARGLELTGREYVSE